MRLRNRMPLLLFSRRLLLCGFGSVLEVFGVRCQFAAGFTWLLTSSPPLADVFVKTWFLGWHYACAGLLSFWRIQQSRPLRRLSDLGPNGHLAVQEWGKV